ncbi:hypothetical protein [Parashewanella curva]|nr:hypothetical protein [Parashewanella curva]
MLTKHEEGLGDEEYNPQLAEKIGTEFAYRFEAVLNKGTELHVIPARLSV